ncbi:MAG: DUF1611 domain-containing protein [Phaeodactylibacter sp.]|nr:DUF1611 domain-containing protein [Phaeodactylibacter sp.]MCB9049067.1 DUF1611 domain-containing protein [Lewinellaceae bacterium]
MTSKKVLDGNAIVYCEGAFNTPEGKTAHGLVRFTERYRVLSVIDSRHAGQDAGRVLDGKEKGIPVFARLEDAIAAARAQGTPAEYFVMGLAPDGGRLPTPAREDVKAAIRAGLHVDSGLHDFLSEDPEVSALAQANGIRIRDIRKTPPRSQLHSFTGNIEKVEALKIAVLGTDSAVGKRTTAWLIVHAFQKAGYKAELVGTGQTAWMQGAKYSIVLDSLINDFVAGELENATYQAWAEQQPDVIVVEGQGSLMNPAYPGGHEILAACRPDIVLLQHAPKRMEYDGFPGYPIHPLSTQIEAVELLSGKPVVAITINHEQMSAKEVGEAARHIEEHNGLPAFDVLLDGTDELMEVLIPYLKKTADEPARTFR